MFVFILGYCWNHQFFCGTVCYDVADEWGMLGSPSACDWIVPGTIEE